ncbi:MAG: helix-turn-helix domain-containing protein [Planctomycetia bacterium]|jgi:transposase-like protein
MDQPISFLEISKAESFSHPPTFHEKERKRVRGKGADMSNYSARNSKSHTSKETKYQAVQAVLRGMSRNEVAQAYGIDRATLYRWIVRFKNDGQDGLSRKPGSGRPVGSGPSTKRSPSGDKETPIES